MSATGHSGVEMPVIRDEAAERFGELKAEIAGLRGELVGLRWVVSIGFTLLIALSIIFRYVG